MLVNQGFPTIIALFIGFGTQRASVKKHKKTIPQEDTKMLRKLKNQKGFTLIEVLVVVIIVAILAAIAVPRYLRYVEKSRSADCMPLGRRLEATIQRMAG